MQIRSAISQIEPSEGSTNIAAALTKIRQECLEDHHSTKHPLVIIVITDGHSDNPRGTLEQAQKLIQKWGAHIFVVGVGDGVKPAELKRIASDEDNVFIVRNYKALKTVLLKTAIKTTSGIKYSNQLSFLGIAQ